MQIGDQGFRLVQSKSDPNIWFLRRQLPDGTLGQDIEAVVGVYVDDFLVTGSSSKVIAVLDARQLNTPAYATDAGGIKFCGMHINQAEWGIYMDQTQYAAELLARYGTLRGHFTRLS